MLRRPRAEVVSVDAAIDRPARVASRLATAAESAWLESFDVVGRSDELRQLGEIVGSLADGRGRVVVVTGEAGIGKTRLAQVAIEDGASRGFSVFAGRGDELERRRPFRLMADALALEAVEAQDAGPRTEIAALLRGGSAAYEPRSEARIADLMRDAVADACRARPTIVVLDDLQWADNQSLLAVHRMAKLVGSLPLLLICATRPYPSGRSLRALLAAPAWRAHQIALSPLGADDVTELALRLSGAPAGSSLQPVLVSAAGNPLWISVVLTSLMRERRVEVAEGGQLELTVEDLSPSLALTIRQELRFLPESTSRLLRFAAAIGSTFSVMDLALASSKLSTDIVHALTPAQQAGIVVANGEELSFRHDLIRKAIYADTAPAVRRGIHRHFAARLAETGATRARVAAQLMLGGGPGDAEAINGLRRAASDAASTSPAIAVKLLNRALELADESPRVRLEVTVQLVGPLMQTGHAKRMEEMCLEALERYPDSELAPLLRVGLASALLLQGHPDGARAACADGLARSPEDHRDRLDLRSIQALAGVLLGDSRGLDLAREIAGTAPRCGARRLAEEAIAEWDLCQGHADRALRALRNVSALREPAELETMICPNGLTRPRMWEAVALLHLDRLNEAAALLEREAAASGGIPALPQAFLADCRYHAGRFDDARRSAIAAIAHSVVTESFTPASALALCAIIALRRGEVEEANELLVRAERVCLSTEIAGDTVVRWVRMLQLESAGCTARAAEAGAGALEAYQRAGFVSYLAWHGPDIVRVAIAAGRTALAHAAVAAADQAAVQLPVPSRRAAALRARALLTGDATAHLQAVDESRKAPRPVDLAMTLRDAAIALARAGDPVRARSLATEALQVLDHLGAHGDARSSAKLLRAAGLAPSARARHTRAASGWESLTAAERKVVALAVEGRSNPQIAAALYLSRTTVAWHLSNVYRKLGLSCRAALVAEAMRQELR